MTAAQFTNPCEQTFENRMVVQNPPLEVNERVVWLQDSGPEYGTVRWVGILPDVGNDWTVGVELDNEVGNNDGSWGDMQLFTTKPMHGLIIPVLGLMKAEEFQGKRTVENHFSQIQSQKLSDTISRPSMKNTSVDSVFCIGERIVCNVEHGTIRWIGRLPNYPQIIAGVEFDNPVGSGSGMFQGEILFSAKPDHASFIPISNLVREERVPLYVCHTNGKNSGKMENMCYQQNSVLKEGNYDNINWNSTNSGSLKRKCLKEQNETTYQMEQSDNLCMKSVFAEEPSNVEVNKIFHQLELAISGGHCEQASRLARKLAMYKISCSIVRKKPRLKPSSTDEISVNIFVEDRFSHIGPFILYVKPLMRVGELKKLVEKQFEFPATIQRWILGKKLATDDEAPLGSYGISDGCPVYLYLMTSESEKINIYRKRLTRYLEALEELEEEEERYEEEEDSDNIKSDNAENKIINCTESKSPSCYTRRVEKENLIMSENRLFTEKQQTGNSRGLDNNAGMKEKGWKCPQCTFINEPTRPGCSMCATDRPEDYVIPMNYKLSKEEEDRIRREKEVEEKAKRDLERERIENYQKLLEQDDKDAIFNIETFECSICMVEYEEGDGVILRDCLHVFCKECLSHTVEHSETAEVKCPFMDAEYSCTSFLQEREIKVLVTPEIFERYLQKSMAAAESQAENSFHCKTADCRGWCLYEDDINDFMCPVCLHTNCLTCQAIHEGFNCLQYQDKLELESSQNDDARKTKEAIEDMLYKGQAMRCPKCLIILMKKWGCDWLKCTMCKTEICWVTKGPRWGPKGQGDISGGCRCGINGKRCHPRCNYCH